MVLVMLLFNIWKGQIAGIAAVISFQLLRAAAESGQY